MNSSLCYKNEQFKTLTIRRFFQEIMLQNNYSIWSIQSSRESYICSRFFLDRTVVCCKNNLISDCQKKDSRNCKICGFCILVSTSISRTISRSTAQRSLRSLLLNGVAWIILWQTLTKKDLARSLGKIRLSTDLYLIASWQENVICIDWTIYYLQFVVDILEILQKLCLNIRKNTKALLILALTYLFADSGDIK